MLNVGEYIQNEIDYINRYELEADKQDIKFLESLTEKDIEKIQEQVNRDDELYQKANETINYYLYHYKKD